MINKSAIEVSSTAQALAAEAMQLRVHVSRFKLGGEKLIPDVAHHPAVKHAHVERPAA